MNAAPFADERETLVSLLSRTEHVKELIDALPAQQRWVIEGVFYRRLSLRKLGQELGFGTKPDYGKTQVARLRDRSLAAIKSELLREKAAWN